MTDVKIPIFIDTNILIRLHVATAENHQEVQEAVRLLIIGNHELWISRQVLREYASVLTRQQPYSPPVSPLEVVKQLRLFEAKYRLADENSQVTSYLYTLLETIPIGGKQVHDANIVATMQAYGIVNLFTLNIADFSRFSGLIKIITPTHIREQ